MHLFAFLHMLIINLSVCCQFRSLLFFFAFSISNYYLQFSDVTLNEFSLEKSTQTRVEFWAKFWNFGFKRRLFVINRVLFERCILYSRISMNIGPLPRKLSVSFCEHIFGHFRFANGYNLGSGRDMTATAKHSICMMMTVDDLHLSNRTRIWIAFAPTDGGRAHMGILLQSRHYTGGMVWYGTLFSVFQIVAKKKSHEKSRPVTKQNIKFIWTKIKQPQQDK